jgi:3-hydroxy-9,10-secoandrosta-1,3,5(10)-triene-9,17-dione monooxygenase reductase component
MRPGRAARPPYAAGVNVTTTDFRTVMGQFATGVTVVTALDGAEPQGITVNALASVSLEPAVVMIALDRRRFILPAIDASHRFAVNILAEDQQWISDCFAGANVTPGRDAFCGAAWRPGATGLPILAGAIAAMECEVMDRFAVGDHFLYVGRVEALALDEPDAPPLLYHRRRYLRIERATTTTVAGKPESPAG